MNQGSKTFFLYTVYIYLTSLITFFNKYIAWAVDAIEYEKYDTAINIYMAMTATLAKKYNINLNLININNQNYNPEDLGHARIKKINHI